MGCGCRTQGDRARQGLVGSIDAGGSGLLTSYWRQAQSVFLQNRDTLSVPQAAVAMHQPDGLLAGE